jgi:hypothetical protein
MGCGKLKPANIIQALALFDEKSASEYGLALWVLLHAQIEYRRFSIGDKGWR